MGSLSWHSGLWGEMCFEAPLVDVDAAIGIQPDCAISDRASTKDGTVVYAVLPACDGANRPCWRAVEDRPNCFFTPQALTLKIDRIDFPPRDTHTVGSCVSAKS